MTSQIELNEDERRLICQLLRIEQEELPSEIRRTDTPQYHDDLVRRQKVVEGLIKRLDETMVC